MERLRLCLVLENKVLFRNFIKKYTKLISADGDKKYSEKSNIYYKKVGLNAIVKNIPERNQPIFVGALVKKYKPEILVITGHDGMIKKGKDFTDIYNYRNSGYFIKAVEEARKNSIRDDLVIFAGACQSYYEGIIMAGANFASSPARILIDFMDPIIVAEKVAITDEKKFVTITDIEDELRDGQRRFVRISIVCFSIFSSNESYITFMLRLYYILVTCLYYI